MGFSVHIVGYLMIDASYADDKIYTSKQWPWYCVLKSEMYNT